MRFVFLASMFAASFALARPTRPATAPTPLPPPVAYDVTEVTVLSPSYMPLAGQQQIDAAYASVGQSYDYKTSGYQILKVSATASLLGLSYTYGLTDDFALAVRVRQSLSAKTSTTYRAASVGTDADLKSGGTYDPDIALNWRLKHANTFGADLDLRALYSPKLMSARSATTTQDGLVGSGRHSLSLSVVATRHVGATEFGGSLEKVIKTDSSIDDGTGGTTEGTDDGELTLSGFALHRVDRLYFGGDLALKQIGGTTSKSQSGVKQTVDATTSKTITLRVKYLLTEASGLSFAWLEEDTAAMKGADSGTSYDLDDARLSGFQLSYTQAF